MCLIAGCPNLQVILKNDVLRKQGSLQGTYKLLGEVNGRDTWRKGTQAIWYYPNFTDWAIGALDSIGTNLRGIASAANEDTELFNVPNNKWQYWDSEWKQIENGDITISCLTGKNSRKKIIMHNCQDKRLSKIVCKY